MATDYITTDGKRFSDSDNAMAKWQAQEHQTSLNGSGYTNNWQPTGTERVTVVANAGVDAHESGDLDRAIAECTRVINDETKWLGERAVAYANRGSAYYKKGEYSNAIADFTKALKFDVIKEKKNLAIIYNLRGISYKNLGEYDKAIADYKEAIRLDPNGGDGKSAKENLANAEKNLANLQSSSSPSAEELCTQGITAYNAKDYAKAVELFRKSADMGDIDAQCLLGSCYEKGEGVKQDYKKAVELYRKAAEQGNDVAQNNLGSCYYSGNGVPQDYKKAAEWFRKSADQGFAMAQVQLGGCYYNGEGVEQDYKKAAEWFRKSADQGDEGAKQNLDNMKEWGLI